MRRPLILLAALLAALVLVAGAAAQAGRCRSADGTTYDVLRWHDNGTERGWYEVLPCPSDLQPTTTPIGIKPTPPPVTETPIGIKPTPPPLFDQERYLPVVARNATWP